MKKWIREHIEPKRFRLFLIFAVLALIVYQGFLHFGVYLPDLKYERQMIGLAAAVLAIVSGINFYKMFRGGFFHTMLAPVGRMLKKALSVVAKRLQPIVDRIRKALGLPDRQRRAKGRDERSFLFNRGKRDDRKRKEEKLRWKDLRDNRERIRFLYVRFVKKCIKKGYRYTPGHTPLENGASWRLKEEDGSRFFLAYTDARFGDEGRQVSDDEVELFAELAGKKIKG